MDRDGSRLVSRLRRVRLPVFPTSRRMADAETGGAGPPPAHLAGRGPARSRRLVLACLALVLTGLAAGLYKVHFPPGPIADEAAYVMMTQSLWHDHDLTYDARDLRRAYRVWDLGPIGLVLSTTDRGKTAHYAKPFAYSLAAVPFYVVFGVQGLVVLNMALFVAMLAAAWWYWQGERGGALFVGGFFFASAAFAYVFWMQPEVFNMACVFFPLLVWQALRRREGWGWREHVLLALAGLAIAAAFISKEPTVLLGAPIAGDLLWRRRLRALLAFAAPLALGLALCWALQWRLTGSISPYRGVQRRSFESEFPFESRHELWDAYPGTTFGSWSALGIETTPRMLARNLEYFLVGRHTGLLPYFPFALFALALFVAGPRDRSRWLLAAAIAGYCLVLFAMRPNNYHGGAGFVGNRYFASIYPAFLFLPARLGSRRGLLAPFGAAGLWTASVLAMPLLQVAPAATLQAHVRSRAFQLLPLELTLLEKIPGYFLREWGNGVWVVPKENFFAEERHPNGVWVRGASHSDVVLVTAAPIREVRVRAFSLSDANELILESGESRVLVRFDSEAKRQGTDLALAVSPAARDLGFFPGTPHEYFYRFRLTDTDGIVPARRDPKSQDLRYLGAFLSFTGGRP